ncbi:MAG: hypothetical protein NTV46_13935 [Verrucomicrobia bacterium]|nr:hypothetical protein [Verrucomicrobiota bacterium]
MEILHIITMDELQPLQDRLFDLVLGNEVRHRRSGSELLAVHHISLAHGSPDFRPPVHEIVGVHVSVNKAVFVNTYQRIGTP